MWPTDVDSFVSWTQQEHIVNDGNRKLLKLFNNSPWGEAEWAIDPWPLRAKGLIVLVSPN